MSLHALILAAGQSSRMGSCKSLLNINGKSLLAYQVEFLRSVSIDDITVVSNGFPDLVSEIESLSVGHVDTQGTTNSMLETLRYALLKSAELTDAILVLPADHPPVNKPLFYEMKQRHSRHPEKIIVPRHGEGRGHPIVIPSAFFSLLLAHFDDEGLRGLLRYAPKDVMELSADESIRTNLNTPEEYQRFLRESINGLWIHTKLSQS